jgi:hypothetical protein
VSLITPVGMAMGASVEGGVSWANTEEQKKIRKEVIKDVFFIF